MKKTFYLFSTFGFFRVHIFCETEASRKMQHLNCVRQNILRLRGTGTYIEIFQSRKNKYIKMF